MNYYKGEGYWSAMTCDHRGCPVGKPHVWNSPHCLYGPYKCEAWPEPEEYQPKHSMQEAS
jgi:hypothetical protein